VPRPAVDRASDIRLPVEEFLAGYDGNTRAAYHRDLTHYLGWCDAGGLAPARATTGDLRRYLQHAAEGGLSPATIARRAVTLRGVNHLLAEHEGLPASPPARLSVRRPRSQTRIRALTSTELGALLDHADRAGSRTAALTWLLATTGLRISEALSIRSQDFTLAADGRWVEVTCKGGLRRSLPLHETCWRHLQPLLSDNQDLAFTTGSGRAWDRHNAARALAGLANQAGIPAPFSPYVLRHTFVTLARQAGCALEDVQDAVGHADPATTRAYDRTILGRTRHPTDRILAGLPATSRQPTSEPDQPYLQVPR